MSTVIKNINFNVRRSALELTFFFLALTLISIQIQAQESDRLILVQKTDSFNLFFLQPIDTKGKKVKIKYDATFIENHADCSPEMVLRATFLFKQPIERIQEARVCLDASFCSTSFQVLNFSVVGGKYRYRLEFECPPGLPSKLLADQQSQITFMINESTYPVSSGIDQKNKPMIRSVISNNSGCKLLEN